MAMYACDYDRRRYRAAQQSVYWTEIGPHLLTTRKIRLCPEHFDLVVDGIEARMVEVNDPSEVPDHCEHCSSPRAFTVQARVYRAHSPDVQYVVELCAACTSVLGNQLRVYNAEPLTDRSGP
jgi:hypothetical protein